MDAIESLGEVYGDDCCAERRFRLIEATGNCGARGIRALVVDTRIQVYCDI